MYCAIGMVAFCSLCSLAVDLGRVQLAKTEMMRSVDAAARAATVHLPSNPTAARAAAISVAAQNTVDGQALVLVNADVVIGKWDAATSTIDTSSATPDAVQVTGYRTVARNGQIPTTFARVIGMPGVNLTFVSTARGTGSPVSYGIVGLNSFAMNSSTCFTGTHNSTTGTSTTGTASNDGSIASNGTMTLHASASVGGTIYYNTASAPGGAIHFDAKTKMASSIPTPATPAAGAYLTSNDNGYFGLPTSPTNVSFGSGSVSVPGGNYVVNNFGMTGGTITFTGPATVWIYGTFGVSGGTISTYQNKPTNLKIKMCSAAAVNLSQSSDLYAVIDAPASALTKSGAGDVVGSVMSSGLTMSGTGGIYFDTALGANGGTSITSTSLVR